MAKATSPMRLQADLVDAASLIGEICHRSTAEQIEYWASIGRCVSNLLDPDVLLSVTAGLARVKVEPVVTHAVDPDALFQALEEERNQGTLADSVTTSTVKYQVSLTHPGLLEQIGPAGTVIGQFQNGKFIPQAEAGRSC
ncbi:MAG: hypothetical protein GY696_13350 [Gammaproteobacteria bacterium]|nr:hypothetical protein [Gammaproteobacteria bacterium]